MLSNEQVIAQIGQVPSQHLEWGWFPTETGRRLTLAFIDKPGIGSYSIVLEYNLKEPFEVSPNASFNTLYRHPNCMGLCWIQTALLNRATNTEAPESIERQVRIISDIENFAGDDIISGLPNIGLPRPKTDD